MFNRKPAGSFKVWRVWRQLLVIVCFLLFFCNFGLHLEDWTIPMVAIEYANREIVITYNVWAIQQSRGFKIRGEPRCAMYISSSHSTEWTYIIDHNYHNCNMLEWLSTACRERKTYSRVCELAEVFQRRQPQRNCKTITRKNWKMMKNQILGEYSPAEPLASEATYVSNKHSSNSNPISLPTSLSTIFKGSSCSSRLFGFFNLF